MTPSREEQDVLLADKLCEVRDTARRIAGGFYERQIAGWKDIVKGYAASFDCSPVVAVPRICDVMLRAGHRVGGVDLMWLTAAAVELTEEQGA